MHTYTSKVSLSAAILRVARLGTLKCTESRYMYERTQYNYTNCQKIHTSLYTPKESI